MLQSFYLLLQLLYFCCVYVTMYCMGNCVAVFLSVVAALHLCCVCMYVSMYFCMCTYYAKNVVAAFVCVVAAVVFSLSVYVCIHIYLYAYAHTYFVHTYTYMHTHIHLHACVSVSVRLSYFLCEHAKMLFIYIYIYIHTHIYIHTGTLAYTVSHNCFYYTSKPECAIPDDNCTYIHTYL